MIPSITARESPPSEGPASTERALALIDEVKETGQRREMGEEEGGKERTEAAEDGAFADGRGDFDATGLELAEVCERGKVSTRRREGEEKRRRTASDPESETASSPSRVGEGGGSAKGSWEVNTASMRGEQEHALRELRKELAALLARHAAARRRASR